MDISQRPQGGAMLVARYFNTDFAASEGRKRDEDIEAAFAVSGLEDIRGHILP